MVNLNLLRVFDSAARLSSFTRAAEELCLTQPGISKHVKGLEDYYNVRLFDRFGRKVRLTQAGEILFAGTREIFRLIDEAKVQIDELQGIASGRLFIAASVTIGIYVVPGVFKQFRKLYPGIDLGLEIQPTREVVDRVLDNVPDVGLVGHRVDDDRFVRRRFMTDEFMLIVPPEHRWADRDSIRVEDLPDEPFVISRRGSGTQTVVEERLERVGVILNRPMEFGNTEAVKKAVEAGLGVSILSRHVVRRELAAAVLRAVPCSGIDLKRGLYSIYRRDKYLTRVAEAFLRLLHQSEADGVSQSQEARTEGPDCC